MNFIKWLLNLARPMSTYKFGFHCYKPLVWCGHKHTVNAFFLCKNTSVWPTRGEFSVITGGPLREERAVDGKLKSHLEWPYLYR